MLSLDDCRDNGEHTAKAGRLNCSWPLWRRSRHRVSSLCSPDASKFVHFRRVCASHFSPDSHHYRAIPPAHCSLSNTNLEEPVSTHIHQTNAHTIMVASPFHGRCFLSGYSCPATIPSSRYELFSFTLLATDLQYSWGTFEASQRHACSYRRCR